MSTIIQNCINTKLKLLCYTGVLSTKLVLGDVLVKETYPNEGIPTGHSCSMTAEAMNVVGT